MLSTHIQTQFNLKKEEEERFVFTIIPKTKKYTKINLGFT